jgi:hypothetical protein
MKAAIFSWVLLFFFLTSGLATNSYQLEDCAHTFSDDFVSLDQLNSSMSSSTIRRFRACGRKFVAPAQTMTVSRISSHLVLPYGTIGVTALISRQTLRALNVVLQI